MTPRIVSRVWRNGILDHVRVADPETGERTNVYVFGGNVVAFPGSIKADPPPCDTEPKGAA